MPMAVDSRRGSAEPLFGPWMFGYLQHRTNG